MRKGQKLTEEQALQVRTIAQQETETQETTAARFGISSSHVCNIKYERRWGSLDPRTGRD